MGRVALAIALTVALTTRAGADTDNSERQSAARELFDRGQAHYNLGEFDQAIAEFKESYELSLAPRLMFNIAQAYRLKKDYEQALFFYNNYLRLVPNAPNRADAEGRIAEMKERLAAAPPSREGAPSSLKPTSPPEPKPETKAEPAAPKVEPAPPAPAANPATPTPAPVVVNPATPTPAPVVVNPTPERRAGASNRRTARIAGVASAGAGVVLIAVGAYFAALAHSDSNALSGLAASQGTWDAHQADLYTEGQRSQGVGIALISVGAAAAVGGAAAIWIGFRR